jgi:hypothetical protein
MSNAGDETQPTVGQSLQQWREAERAAAVARRGRVAAETAARLAVQSASAELADADAVSAVADVDEAEAQVGYKAAVNRATDETKRSTE